MSREKGAIDSRSVVKPVEMGDGNELYQAAVTGCIFGEKSEMISGVTEIVRPILNRSERHVGFTSDDRFNADFARLLVEFYCPVQVTVIRDCHSWHVVFLRLFHQFLHSHGSIEERIFRMQMEVNERIASH